MSDEYVPVSREYMEQIVGGFKKMVFDKIKERVDAAAVALRGLPAKDELVIIVQLIMSDLDAPQLMDELKTVAEMEGNADQVREDVNKTAREAFVEQMVLWFSQVATRMFRKVEGQIIAERNQDKALGALAKKVMASSDPFELLCEMIVQIDAAAKAKAEANRKEEQPGVVAGPSS